MQSVAKHAHIMNMHACNLGRKARTGPGHTAAPLELEKSSRRTASKSIHAELTDAIDGSCGAGACGGGGEAACLDGAGIGRLACGGVLR